MRQKLALTIAALSFAIATAVGVGWAGAESSEAPPSPVGSLTPVLPATDAPTPETPDAPACSNLADDDGDGLVDLEDPDCTEPGDAEEATEAGATPPPRAPAEEGAEITPAPNPQPGVQVGSGIDAAEVKPGPDKKNAVRNDDLGDVSGGGGASGGVSAPPATAGDQPPVGGISGGSAF